MEGVGGRRGGVLPLTDIGIMRRTRTQESGVSLQHPGERLASLRCMVASRCWSQAEELTSQKQEEEFAKRFSKTKKKIKKYSSKVIQVRWCARGLDSCVCTPLLHARRLSAAVSAQAEALRAELWLHPRAGDAAGRRGGGVRGGGSRVLGVQTHVRRVGSGSVRRTLGGVRRNQTE